MKLQKAREIIQLNIKEAGRHMPPDVLTALKIHVDAAYRIETNRRINNHPDQALLPTETAE